MVWTQDGHSISFSHKESSRNQLIVSYLPTTQSRDLDCSVVQFNPTEMIGDLGGESALDYG
jgi:hypothetical protein